MQKRISARPKYLLIGAVSALLIATLFTAPAVAHGACLAKAYKPSHPSGNMLYSGEYTCGTTSHSAITLAVSLERRQPGGTWSQISSRKDTEGPATRNFTAVITSIAFDCRKDYRTRANGGASPGGHQSTITTNTLLHSC